MCAECAKKASPSPMWRNIRCQGTRLELGLPLGILGLIGSGLFTRRKTRKESEKWALSAPICDQTKPT